MTPKPGTEETIDAGAIDTVAAGATPEEIAAAQAEFELTVVERATYRILGEHDRGGLGRILRARDIRTGRLVAIKESLQTSGEASTRFRREAVITANLEHPGIVPVYEVGRWPSGEPFYAMKLVDGRSLREAIEACAGRSDRLALLPHVTAVAETLAYAHSRGIIHRDLKPANVLLGAFGETVVIDWGLAMDTARPEADAPGSLLGTPAYMAPEQARRDEVDPRTDVYAIGAILYHVLGGKVPYPGSQAKQVVADVLAGPPEPLPAGIPDDLRAVVDKAMARAPDARYRDAGEVAAELRRFQTGQLVAAHSYTAAQLVWRWATRHRAVVATAALAAAALAVVGTVAYVRVGNQRDLARREEARAKRARDDAETSRGIARAQLADLHAELGRRQLLDGAPLRALPHLAAAARIRGTIDPALSYLIGLAHEPLAPLLHTDQAHAQAYAMDVSPDGSVAVTGGHDGKLIAWDVATGERRASVQAEGGILDVAVLADGRVFAVAGGRVLGWRAGGGALDDLLPGVDIDAGRDVLAVGGNDGSVELRSLPDLALRRRIAAHDTPIDYVRVTPDGTRVLAIDKDSDGVLFDAGSGRALARFEHLAEPATLAGGRRIALSSGSKLLLIRTGDGATLAHIDFPADIFTLRALGDDRLLVGRDDGVVTLLDGDGQRLADLPGHTRGTVTVGASIPGGRFLATGDGAGVVRVWQLAHGTLAATFVTPDGAIMGLSASPDGRRLLGATGAGTLYEWDLDRPFPRITLAGHTDQARRAVYSPSGAQLATGSRDGTVRLWSATTGALVRTLAGHTGPVTWVAWSPDGRRLSSSSRDGTARIWDAATGASLLVLGGQAGQGQASQERAIFTPDGKWVVTGGGRRAQVWDAASGELHCATADAPADLMGIELSRKGDRFVSYGLGGRAQLWATADCRHLHDIETGHAHTVAAGFAPGDETLVLAGGLPADQAPGDRAITFVDPDTGAATTPLAGLGERLVGAVAWSPDGKRLATGGLSGRVRVWDLATFRQVADLDGATAVVGAVAFAGESLVAAASEDTLLRVWDARTGTLLASFPDHGQGTFVLRVRPDGRQLVTAGLDATPHLWSVPAWPGSIDALDRLIDCRVPWRLDGSTLVARPLPACAVTPPAQ